MNACFCCVRFSFSYQAKRLSWGTSRNELFCVEWDVKTSTTTQSINSDAGTPEP